MNHSRNVIRLFPLPNVVLFPRAILPLHIFEERYKQMVADALNHDGKIAMALLKPGWMREYYDHPAIEPVVCVGQIISYEQLADGKYNLLLQGVQRAVIEKEMDGKTYRQAQVSPLAQMPVPEIDLSCERWRLHELFLQAELGDMGKKYAELVGSGMRTAEVADILAYNLIESAELKQSLLAEADVQARVRRIVDHLQMIIPPMSQGTDAGDAGSIDRAGSGAAMN